MWIIRTLVAIREAITVQAAQLKRAAGQLAVIAGHLAGLRDVLHRIESEQATQGTQITGLIERTRIMATQDQVNDLAAQLNSIAAGFVHALDGIQADLDTLKAAHPDVDLSALEASVAALAPLAQRAADIDAENPAPAEPTA